MEILSEPDTSPFKFTSSDVKEVYPTLHLLDFGLKRTVRLKLNDIDSFDTVMILLFAINELDLNLVLFGPFSIVM